MSDIDERLRRIEGQLTMLLNAAEITEDQRDLHGEIRDAYRRGYRNGYCAYRRGAKPYPEGDAPTGRQPAIPDTPMRRAAA